MKYTISQFRKDFPTDERCLNYIFKNRFPDATGFHLEKGTMRFTHQKGKKHISPMAGTIFENSRVPLTLWFYAIYLFSVSKNGVSAKELQRQLGITYKCAWRMATQIRKLMEQDSDKLSGIVEIDEAYVQKNPVIGSIERKGRVKIHAAKNMSGSFISVHAAQTISPEATIHSDSNPSYSWLDRHYKRESVNHSKEYVRGTIHINSMEAFWLNVKRSLSGTHHFVSPKYLQSYLDFYAFHHDLRTSSIHPFLVLISKALSSPCAKV